MYKNTVQKNLMQLNRDDDRSVNISDVCVSVQKRAFFSLDGFVPSFLRRLQDGNGVFCFGHWAQKDSLMTKFFFQKKGRRRQKEKGEVFGVGPVVVMFMQ